MNKLPWSDAAIRKEMAAAMGDTGRDFNKFGFVIPFTNPLTKIYPITEERAPLVKIGEMYGVKVYACEDVPKDVAQLRYFGEESGPDSYLMIAIFDTSPDGSTTLPDQG